MCIRDSYERDHASEFAGGPPVALMDYDHDQYPMVSAAAPRHSGASAGLDHVKDPGGAHDGKVIFNSAREKREYCRVNGYSRDYDPY